MKSEKSEKDPANRSHAIRSNKQGEKGNTLPAVPVLQCKPLLQKVSEENDEELLQDQLPKQLKERETTLQRRFVLQKKEPKKEKLPVQERFTVQRKTSEKEEEVSQAKFISSENTLQPELPVQEFTPQKQPVQKKENKTGLPDNLKEGVENLSGIAMDDVRIHYNSAKPAQLSALAYAQATDIHVAPGQEKHLPHEAWHVVQQKQGRVKPTLQMKGRVGINDAVGLEVEADLIGAKALAPVAQRLKNVYLETDEPDKKSLVAEGKVKDFEGGTTAKRTGWLGVDKYRARYQITSKDGKYQNSDEVGPLKNVFTNGEAGHVLGQQNGGNGGDSENVFAQDGGTNNGKYKSFENGMRAMLNNYENTDKVIFKSYLVGDEITQGDIGDAAMSEASDISSDED